MVPPDAPPDVLVERWSFVESLPVADLWLPDHTANYGNRHADQLDSWAMVAAAAVCTTRLRIGTLASNMVLRPPVMLARAAIAVDNLSGGRLELGIGSGFTRFDHDAVGVPFWPMAERMARFGEYWDVVRQALAGAVDYRGRYVNATASPQPLASQVPVPLVACGGSRAVLDIAVRSAAGWNTHGPYDAAHDPTITFAIERNRELTSRCLEAGRDPRSLRRSFLFVGSTDPFADPVRATDDVARLRAAGFDELVAIWPKHTHSDALAALVSATG